MRNLMRPASVLAAAAAMFLAGVVVATAGGGSGGDSTGPSTSAPGGASPALVSPMTTNATPVPTFVPSPRSQTFVSIAPCRIVDTRKGGGKLASSSARNFAVSGTTGFTGQGGNATGCGIPASAAAVAVSIVATGATAGGFLTAWPAGTSRPLASTLNFPKGQTTNTGATVPITPNANPAMSVYASGGPVNVVIDVTGYYEPQLHLIILSDGTVWYGNNAHLTEVIHTTGTGSYTLVFDRSLAGCNVLTTDNDQRDVQAIGSWGGSQLTVATSHEASGVFTQIDESFQVFVIC